MKKSLYHFGPHGQWLSSHTLPEPAQALSWDPTTSCLWVGTQKTITAFHDTGSLCKVIDLGAHADLQDLTVDPATGDLWVAMKEALRRYDAGGSLIFEADLKKLAYVTSDHHEGVWIAADKRLMRMDRTGVILLGY